MNFHPIFLTPEQIANYYEGYSNSTIWPLCHYFFAFTRYRKDFWEAYRKVNALFCEEILRRIEPDDIVWVQDYQLMLLPGLLREHRPALRIGYFHHIPFPSYELFRILPERAEILRGVLGSRSGRIPHPRLHAPLHRYGGTGAAHRFPARRDADRQSLRPRRRTANGHSTTPPSTASPRTPERNR